MFTLSKKFRFEASHQLPHHDGKCARLHGHSWQGSITVEGSALHSADDDCIDSQPPRECPKAGMLIDYGDLSAVIAPVVEQHLDHYHLNESLQMESPTSEAIARWVFEKIAPSFGAGVALLSVTIEETCTSSATYDTRTARFSASELAEIRNMAQSAERLRSRSSQTPEEGK